ncbi:MAG: hypothetical protein FJZ88_10220, partial [Chloroflexi bacterium]|nr:hypothetical protein [Chloroflexota bacterium]
MPLVDWLEKGGTIRSERGFISTANLKRLLRERVYAEINPTELLEKLSSDSEAVRRELVELVNRIVAEEGYLLTDEMRQGMQAYILDEILGYGPIEPLLRDPSIEEVMVNRFTEVWVARRKGGNVQLELVPLRFDDDEHVMHV